MEPHRFNVRKAQETDVESSHGHLKSAVDQALLLCCAVGEVSIGSTIQVKRNAYSVHSRLIGHQVDVVIDADWIIGSTRRRGISEDAAVVGSGKHAINYRHVICDRLFGPQAGRIRELPIP